MPKYRRKGNIVYEYVLNLFQRRYEKQRVNRVRQKNAGDVKYTTIDSIIDRVLEDKRFCEPGMSDEVDPDKEYVSRGTIRGAINRLINENKISMTNGSYEYVPHMEDALKKHPILSIGKEVIISIGVPEDMVVLTVSNGFSVSIAEYLSALFYKGDIVFLPIGNHILAISVFPQAILEGNESTITGEPLKLRNRIEVALHHFAVEHPNFDYGYPYEFSYHVLHNPEIIDTLETMARANPTSSKYETMQCLRRVREAILHVNDLMENEADYYDGDFPTPSPTKEELEAFGYYLWEDEMDSDET